MTSPKSEVRDFYRGKTVLVTGTTGFVGKVLLEKMIRAFPDIKRIYLMIRPRPNLTLAQRVHESIFSTQLFEPLYNERKDLDAWIKEKVIPIEGDLVLKGLGIKPDVRARLVEEVNVILNSAASVNFMEPLRDALQHNYFGSLRILDLAHECKHLISMVHVSSAYVNVNQKPYSLVPEALI
jgi:thioester reductase-like protein